MIKKKLTSILGCCFLLVILAESGCTRKSLDYRKQEGYVNIALQWDEGYAPEGSRFYFYPETGEEVIVQDCPKEGFSGTLPTGDYKLLVLNSDMTNVALRNEHDYETAEVYAVPEELARSAGGCIAQPENLLLAQGLDNAEILQVPYQDTVSASASCHSAIKHVRLLFKIDDRLSIRSCSGTLSGVSSSIYCSTGECAHVPGSVNFTALPAGNEYDFIADITVLNLITPQNSAQTHILELDMEESDGTAQHAVFDLTNAVRDILEETGGEIPVEIRLDIRLTLIDGIMQAVVRPWDENGSGAGEL